MPAKEDPRRAKTPKRAKDDGKAKRSSKEAKPPKEPEDDKLRRREERAKRREEKSVALATRNPSADGPTRPDAVRFEDDGQARSDASVAARPPSAYPSMLGSYSGWEMGELDERAFSTQLASLHGALNGQLALKKRELVSSAQRVETNIERVQSARQQIERETRTDAEGILERLRVHERSKLAVLQSELAKLLSTMKEMDDFTAEVLDTGMAATSDQRRAVAPRLPALTDRASRLSNIPVESPPLVRHDDLPRETEARALVIRRHDALEGVLRVKDAMCWALLNERRDALPVSADGPAGPTNLGYSEGQQLGTADETSAGALRAAVRAAKGAAEEKMAALAGEYEEEMTKWGELAVEQQKKIEASEQEIRRLRSNNEELQIQLATREGRDAVRAVTSPDAGRYSRRTDDTGSLLNGGSGSLLQGHSHLF
ncbi:hypothetical protein T492DRAFT_1101623 [Pavlovales sp. CCMP2436]|nr:hypothetical protein T492DRAFT_1101623 [Pavlovales sp. CCMP2436]